MQHENKHTIAVTILDARRPADEQPPAGELTVHGQPYDLTDEQALELVLPEGAAPTRLDFSSVPGFVRFGATMVPADRFRSLTVTVISSSRPPTPEETAALEEPKE